jgi:hypothetical protein
MRFRGQEIFYSLFQNVAQLMVEVKLNDLNVSKSLERFARLLNCKKIVQVVGAENIYRQVKIGSQICHLVSAGIFLKWQV